MKNTFDIKGDIVEIHLRNKNNIVHKKAIIDLDDLPKIQNLRWSYNGDAYGKDGYCRNVITNTYLHNLVFGIKEGYEVDHIDRNKLNNRKNNLRHVTHSDNNYNMSNHTAGTSGVMGVSYRKDRNKWRAHIKVNKKYVHLGHFDDFEDTVEARKEAEKKYIKIEILPR